MSNKKNLRKQRKKNKALRPWCWYCEREFEDEKVLMQHQKAKHFKCNQCPRRLNTAGGLAVHIQQVHKLEVDQLPKIDNALPGRDGYEVEIFGMEGIPAPDVADYKRRKEIELGLTAGSITQPPAKRPKIENKVIGEAELKIQLQAHRALMGATEAPPVVNGDIGSATVYNAEPQAYSAPAVPIQAPPVPLPGMPFPPGGFPPPGMHGAPPFPPPIPGMPFSGPPPPGFSIPPGFPPMGMGPPPGIMPPFAPNGLPPVGMPPFVPPNLGTIPGQPGPLPTAPPNFVPTALNHPPPQPPPIPNITAKEPLTESPPVVQEFPPSQYVNPPPKSGTTLIWNDPNLSPEESKVKSDPAYLPKVDVPGEQSRGTKRARAEDFL